VFTTVQSIILAAHFVNFSYIFYVLPPKLIELLRLWKQSTPLTGVDAYVMSQSMSASLARSWAESIFYVNFDVKLDCKLMYTIAHNLLINNN